MAPGPSPKPASQRRRRNVASTARTLALIEQPLPAPTLPMRQDDESWNVNALAFWQDLWASPMAPEYDRSDLHGLYMIADLIHIYWTTPSTSAIKKKELASEIRLQRQAFGLSPIDRRRLQWEIEKAEEATDKGQRRRTQSSRSGGSDDPRLKVIDVDEIR